MVIQVLLQERLQQNNKEFNISETLEIEEYKHSSLRTPELYFGYKFANGFEVKTVNNTKPVIIKPWVSKALEKKIKFLLLDNLNIK